MKLCPQCEFIYEDDQSICDMDGEALVYDTRPGASPGTVQAVSSGRPAKLRLRIIAPPVVAGLVLSALLFIAFCGPSPLLYSNVVSPTGKSQAAETGPRQLAPLPDNSALQPAISASELPTNAEASSKSSVTDVLESAPTPASESARKQVVNTNLSKTSKAIDSRLMIPRGLPPLPRLPPPSRLPLAKSVPKSDSSQKQRAANQQPGSTQKALIVDIKPAGGNPTKRSKVGAFLKKTARVLKKPFSF